MPDPCNAEIVLVEDTPSDIRFVTRAMEKCGITATMHVARDGEEALDFLFTAGKPKVVLLDLRLPKISGLEVLRRLKADPRTNDIPVVAFSSSDLEQDVQEAYDAGVNAYVVKPPDYQGYLSIMPIITRFWLSINASP